MSSRLNLTTSDELPAPVTSSFATRGAAIPVKVVKDIHQHSSAFVKRNQYGDVRDREKSCSPVNGALEPVVVDLRLQEDDLVFFEGELGRVFSVEVVQGSTRGLDSRGGAGVGRM